MMIPTAKCPSCQKVCTDLQYEVVIAKDGLFSQEGWKTVFFICPHCRSVLSAQIDPITIRSQILEHVEQVVAPLVREQSALRSQVATLQATLEQILRPRR